MQLPSQRSESQAHICLPVWGTPWWVLLQHSITLRVFFILECGIACFLCTVHAFEAWASSSSPRLPLWPNFVSFAASIAKVAHGEKSWTQSLTHPTYLMPREQTRLCSGKHLKKVVNLTTEKVLITLHSTKKGPGKPNKKMQFSW